MSRIGIIAAGGESRRTGLGQYTNKAVLPLRGKSLLAHQIDFLRRSGAECTYVIARPAHVRLLGSILPPEDRVFAAFVCSDCATGWAGEVERVARFIRDGDEVILVSCDNDHGKVLAPELKREQEAIFTYTNWVRADRPPTDGPVLARAAEIMSGVPIAQWSERVSAGFTGDFFSGYVVARGEALKNALGSILPVDGKKEFTSLLATLQWASDFEAVPYGATYEDVRGLRELALLDAGKSVWDDAEVQIGAGVLLHDPDGKVFLTERQDGLGWVMPGGLVDKGELYLHAAVRELREEVGIEVAEEDLRLLSVIPTIGKHGGPACSVIFHAKWNDCVTPRRAILNKNEVRNVGWFDKIEASKLTIPFGLRAAVDDWFAGRELDCR